MKFTPQELIDLVERASTLSERLDYLGDRVYSPKTDSNPASLADLSAVEARMQRWCQVVAKGDNTIFDQRLALEGLNQKTTQQLLTGVSLAEQPLPSWAHLLNEVMDVNATATENPEVRRSLFAEEPVAFEEIFLPFLAVAQTTLRTQVGDYYYHLTNEAHTRLEQILLARLVYPCSQSLELEFSLFRSKGQSDLDRLLGQLRGTPSNAQYQAFIQNLTAGGLRSFLQKYPVLARLVAIALEFWLETTGEFLRRLATDLPAIQSTFSADTGWGAVEALHPSLSDPHHRGRTVIGLQFASGVRLIYKPRNIGLESAYFRLLDWLNDRIPQADLSFKVLKTLDCTTHGWVEYVPYETCETAPAVQQYYRQAGRLLCVIYALRGTDFHYDNLIVSANQPVVVDLEMLLHPPSTKIQSFATLPQSQQLAILKIDDSVLKTMFLPRTFLLSGQLVEISALGDTSNQEFKAQKFNHVNTDSMAWVEEASTLTTLTNSPFASGVAGSLNDYADEVVDGFVQMYHLLMHYRADLLTADSPLAAFANQPGGRYIHRNTSTYYSILYRAFHPNFMGDGADFSIELEVCSRSGVTMGWTADAGKLMAAERRSLECMDLPHFLLNSSSCSLMLEDDEAIASFFDQSGYASVIERIQDLNEADLTLQTKLIRYSTNTKAIQDDYWYESTANSSDASLTALDKVVPMTPVNIDFASSSPTHFLQQATEIAQEIERQAIVGSDGSVSWLGLGSHSQIRQLQLQPLEASLYDGNCGIALFLAALDRVTEKQRWQDLIQGALKPVHHLLHYPDAEACAATIQKMGIGGAGVGSIIYVLANMNQWLRDPTLVENAQLAASFLTPRVIAGDRQFGILSGTAGALLGLIALHQVTEDSGALEAANRCGEHLLNHATIVDDTNLWLSPDGQPLTGFAHGASGIAYALTRLFAVTGNSAFLTTAKEAIASEQKPVELPVSISWANGIAGVALAQLGMQPYLETIHFEQRSLIQRQELDAVDHIYGGNFGRLETLCVAAERLHRPELLKQVHQTSSHLIVQAKTSGGFRLSPNSRLDLYNPAFFHGTAGIGYQILRFAYPKIVPSVLLWES